MWVICDKCGHRYDDAQQWTICPHSPLGHAVDDLCPQCDTLRSVHGPCRHQVEAARAKANASTPLVCPHGCGGAWDPLECEYICGSTVRDRSTRCFISCEVQEQVLGPNAVVQAPIRYVADPSGKDPNQVLTELARESMASAEYREARQVLIDVLSARQRVHLQNRSDLRLLLSASLHERLIKYAREQGPDVIAEPFVSAWGLPFEVRQVVEPNGWCIVSTRKERGL